MICGVVLEVDDRPEQNTRFAVLGVSRLDAEIDYVATGHSPDKEPA